MRVLKHLEFIQRILVGGQGQVALIASFSVGYDGKSLRFVTDESDIPQRRVGLVLMTLHVKMAFIAVGRLPKTDRGVGSPLTPSEIAVLEHLFALRIESPVIPFAYKNITAISSAVTTGGNFYHP